MGEVQAAGLVVEQSRIAVVGPCRAVDGAAGRLAVGIVVVGGQPAAAGVDQIAHRAQVILGVVVGCVAIGGDQFTSPGDWMDTSACELIG